jgi:DNA-binding beta-propeller fold protein YncE
LLRVVDTATDKVVKEVPFGDSVRPFTVDGRGARAYVCVNNLLGFEVGDLRKGERLHRVEVPGRTPGPVKRHGCPSHGVGLSPDEREVWVVDAAHRSVHIFENGDPPAYRASVELFDEPGWITFTRAGDFAYPSTGEVIDPRTRKIVARLQDEEGRPVQSEKVIEISFENGEIRCGDQFGLGRVRG